MILDRLDEWRRYPFGPAWRTVFAWLAAHRQDAPADIVPLDGDRLVVRPGRYTTLSRDDAALESHRRFADVQAVLKGVEWGECYDSAALTVATPYDEARDVAFYDHPAAAPARFLLRPGFFALFLPGEAHMTQLATVAPGDAVVKLVVKMDAALLCREANDGVLQPCSGGGDRHR